MMGYTITPSQRNHPMQPLLHGCIYNINRIKTGHLKTCFRWPVYLITLRYGRQAYGGLMVTSFTDETPPQSLGTRP